MNTISIKQADYISDLKIKFIFSDNTSQLIDFEQFFLKRPHPQYDKYKNPKFFKIFELHGDMITWGKNWDLDFRVENLYNNNLLKHYKCC